MSKTTPGRFHDFEFWVYDVCQGLLFAEMIAVIEATPPPKRPEWMGEILPGVQLGATERFRSRRLRTRRPSRC